MKLTTIFKNLTFCSLASTVAQATVIETTIKDSFNEIIALSEDGLYINKPWTKDCVTKYSHLRNKALPFIVTFGAMSDYPMLHPKANINFNGQSIPLSLVAMTQNGHFIFESKEISKVSREEGIRSINIGIYRGAYDKEWHVSSALVELPGLTGDSYSSYHYPCALTVKNASK